MEHESVSRLNSAMGPVVLLLLVAVAAPAAAELPRLEHSPKADGSLSILAVGDWGRRGEFNQSRVATQVRTTDLLHGSMRVSKKKLHGSMAHAWHCLSVTAILAFSIGDRHQHATASYLPSKNVELNWLANMHAKLIPCHMPDARIMLICHKC